MSANITDYFNKASNMNGSYPAVATVTSARSVGGATLSCDDLSSWATDTPVHFSTFQTTADGSVDTTTQTDWKGIVVGNTITEMTRLAGAADSGNASGDRVELNPTIGWLDDLVTGLLVSHKQNGGLKDSSVTESTIATSAVTNSKIADSAVTNAKISDGTIQAQKIDFTTFMYFEGFSDFTATTSEASYGTLELPAGTYMIGVQAHVGTNGNSATNYSGEVKARLNSVSGTQVAYANYYFWQSGSNQDIGVDIFNIGKATLTATTTVHFTAKRSGNMTKVWRPALFAIRIS